MRCQRILRVGLVAVASLLGTGCLTRTTTPEGPRPVVRGIVLAGPTCPVVSADSTGCDPVPVVGKVTILRGSDVIGEASIAHDGSFEMEVAAGSYSLVVVPAGATGFPRCNPIPLVVTEANNAPVSIECDTGIR